MRDVAGALERVVHALERLGVRYMVGGSVASSIYGIQRSTRDIDIVASVSEQHAAPLASDLSGEFYIDAEEVRDSLRRGRPFNLIHFATSYKFDIFPLIDDPYYQTQLQRSELKDIAFGEGVSVKSHVAAAEDTVLTKLVWYRHGGEQSDQQWNDLRGVRAVQGTRLDQAYLRTWAAHLRVEDLLDRLLSEDL
jgi:hypothetical protein